MRRLAPRGRLVTPTFGLLGLRPRRGVPGVPDVQGLLARVRVQASRTPTRSPRPAPRGARARCCVGGLAAARCGSSGSVRRRRRTPGSRSTSTSGTPTPEIDARYVITGDSTAIASRDFGALLFGSREHVESMLSARRILASHHSEYPPPSGDRSSNATSRGPGSSSSTVSWAPRTWSPTTATPLPGSPRTFVSAWRGSAR